MKKRLFLFSLFFALGIFLFADVSLADSSYGLDTTAGAADLKKYGKDLPKLIGNVVGTALSLVSVVFFILAVYGGFRMMLARGKDEEFTKGRDILIHATVGLIIILASYAITRLVFDSVGAGGGGGGGGGDTQTEEKVPHCLTAEKSCVTGGGGPCSGTLYDSKEKCEAAKSGTNGGGTPDPNADKPHCFNPSGATAADKCAIKQVDADGKGSCPNGSTEFSTKAGCEAAASGSSGGNNNGGNNSGGDSATLSPGVYCCETSAGACGADITVTTGMTESQLTDLMLANDCLAYPVPKPAGGSGGTPPSTPTPPGSVAEGGACTHSNDCAGGGALVCGITGVCEASSFSCVDTCDKHGTNASACTADANCEMLGADCARKSQLDGSCTTKTTPAACGALSGCSWE